MILIPSISRCLGQRGILTCYHKCEAEDNSRGLEPVSECCIYTKRTSGCLLTLAHDLDVNYQGGSCYHQGKGMDMERLRAEIENRQAESDRRRESREATEAEMMRLK